MSTPFIAIADVPGLTADARGTAVITAACDMVRTATEQDISPVVNGGTVILDGTGTDCLLLPQLPVLNAGTVIENVGSAGAGTLTLDTDYKLSDNGELYRLPSVTECGYALRAWWPGRQNIQVTYSHGYSTVPGDLKEVAVQMAKRLASQNGNVVFESLGQRSVRYAGPASDWTGTERIVLRKYKQSK